MLTWPEALKQVDPYIEQHGPYRVVSRINAQILLQDKYKTLEDNPLHNVGPNSHSVYYWNVVSYLMKD